MELIQFVGGIGDALLNIYGTDNYLYLETLKHDQRVHVDCISVNPKLPEIFMWHPKKYQITLTSREYDRFPIDAELRRLQGLPAEIRPYKSHGFPVPKDICDQIKWYTSVIDEKFLDSLRAKPFMVFCCGAGHPLRNVPMHIAREAASVCNDLGIAVVQIGSTYNVTSPMCACVRSELPIDTDIAYVNLIDKLSVPGSLTAIDMSVGVFTCFSSPVIEAWFRRKPVYVVNQFSLIPGARDPFVQRFHFGIEYEECGHATHDEWNKDNFRSWMLRHVIKRMG